MSRKFNTITKAELIEALEDLDDSDLIAFASNYGDHSRTMQVHCLRGDVELEHIEESAYSDSGFAVAEHEPDEDEMDDTQEVWILS
jgi:hypothetical protein